MGGGGGGGGGGVKGRNVREGWGQGPMAEKSGLDGMLGMVCVKGVMRN